MASGYVDLDYTPGKDDLNCLFYVEPAGGLTLEKAAVHVTAESSIGTWTDVVTMKDDIRKLLQPHIYDLDEENHQVKIAYPLGLFELGSVPQLLSSIAGNIYGMKAVNNLRLLDFTMPEKYIRSFKGPHYGIEGVRDVVYVKERPLVGTIVKPKVGLSPKEHADVAYEAWVGGCDIVKDDENLTNQSFNRFDERVMETIEARNKAEQETGENKVYMANITAESKEMLRRMEYVKDHGGRYAMVDVVTLGFSSLQTVRDAGLSLVLHGHRAMHAAITRNKQHGLTMLALAKLCRLVGVDQLHIGTAVGKMEGPAQEVVSIREEITYDEVSDGVDRLDQNWHGMKPVFPVSSGGLHPGHVDRLMDIMGHDIIIQMGGGIHGHPKGTRAGATAARQAVDAVMEDKSLQEQAQSHKELKMALEKWLK
ncbi:MAG: type III ribulose-bisphosphate carboxylase [Candidatus Altiarchaeales archaeon]|nr:type III ribulose-bisphosphate carboxylase [Candidatus Altiarchaeales archaeon]MBD3417167.1 type III ribulose-bisphosphate carboxylase [Candidatus Altiarchaeales archaeon]